MTDRELDLIRYACLAMLAHVERACNPVTYDSSVIDVQLARIHSVTLADDNAIFDMAMMVDGDVNYTGTVERDVIDIGHDGTVTSSGSLSEGEANAILAVVKLASHQA